jgi:hypothetical protein
VERVIVPLSRSKEVFKAIKLNQDKGGFVNEIDRERTDPATMVVAHHWMELAALDRDDSATKYLRSSEEITTIY